MPTDPKIKKYWSKEANAWVDENYTSEGVIGKTPCKACQQEFSDLKFGYCSACREDIEKADLHLAIKNHIPKDWRIGQFVLNFLRWLAQNDKAPIHIGLTMGMADPFHLSDDDFINYWFLFLKEIK